MTTGRINQVDIFAHCQKTQKLNNNLRQTQARRAPTAQHSSSSTGSASTTQQRKHRELPPRKNAHTRSHSHTATTRHACTPRNTPLCLQSSTRILRSLPERKTKTQIDASHARSSATVLLITLPCHAHTVRITRAAHTDQKRPRAHTHTKTNAHTHAKRHAKQTTDALAANAQVQYGIGAADCAGFPTQQQQRQSIQF